MSRPPQYEDPQAAARVAIFKARLPAEFQASGSISGAPILNFRKGWAIPVIVVHGKRSHWFTRIDGKAVALCSVEAPLELIHGAGSYPRCQTCIVRMSSAIKRGAPV